MGRKSKAKFELRGHTLPGVNQKSETSNIKDGKSPSSAFQMQSPMKAEGDNIYTGATIDPYAHKSIGSNIPSFSDFVPIEQQRQMWDKYGENRFKRKKEDYEKRMEEERNDPERRRQFLADQGELHSELAAIDKREQNEKQKNFVADSFIDEPWTEEDYDAIGYNIPEEDSPE